MAVLDGLCWGRHSLRRGLLPQCMVRLGWLAPLRPGDDLTLDVEVMEARVSKSRPDTGIVTFKAIARNAAGQALCEMVSPIIIGRRDGAGAS